MMKAALLACVLAVAFADVERDQCTDANCQTACNKTVVKATDCLEWTYRNRTFYHTLTCNAAGDSITEQGYTDNTCTKVEGRPHEFKPAQCHPDRDGSRELKCVAGANAAGLAFSRTITALNKAHGKVTFDHGCTGSDAHGSNNCNWAWGATAHVTYDVGLDEDLTHGSKIAVDATLDGVLPLKFTCAACGANCTFTIPILSIPVNFAMPPCPVAKFTAADTVPLTLPDKNPAGVPISVKATAQIHDATGAVVLGLSVTANLS
jgi:hypothetical protein